MRTLGFTAEASLRTEGRPSVYREVPRVSGTWSRVIPAVSCSSKDGGQDCFCPKGCCRTQNTCTCCGDQGFQGGFGGAFGGFGGGTFIA
jgi:hypothetical protein